MVIDLLSASVKIGFRRKGERYRCIKQNPKIKADRLIYGHSWCHLGSTINVQLNINKNGKFKKE